MRKAIMPNIAIGQQIKDRHKAPKAKHATNMATAEIECFEGQRNTTEKKNATAESIASALKANRQLQYHLLSRILKVSQIKKANRQECVQISLALDNYRLEKRNKQNHRYYNNKIGTNDGCQIEFTSEKKTSEEVSLSDKKENKKTYGRSSNRWMYDEHRKWRRRFFVDPDKSIPEPNADVIQRREWEGNIRRDMHRFIVGDLISHFSTQTF